RRREGKGLPTSRAADQIAAGQDVEPLVVAPDLQKAPVLAEQVKEVIRLDERVVELDEAETLLLEAFPIRAVLHQLIDSEVAADVTQEIDVVERPQPIGVVDEQRSAA